MKNQQANSCYDPFNGQVLPMVGNLKNVRLATIVHHLFKP